MLLSGLPPRPPSSSGASVGGVSLPHLNQLEVEVMSLLSFSLLVDAPALESARERLLRSSTA